MYLLLVLCKRKGQYITDADHAMCEDLFLKLFQFTSTRFITMIQVNSKGGLSKKLFDLAYSRRLSAVNGSWLGAWGPERHLWNLLVFKKVQAILGGRVRFVLSGGAPLSGDTQRFINICLGLVLLAVFADFT